MSTNRERDCVTSRQDSWVPFGDVPNDSYVVASCVPDEVIEVVEAAHGDGAELFAVDQSVARLVSVRFHGSDDVDLGGELRTAMLRSESYHDGEDWWIPVPERDHTVFVVRSPTPPASVEPDLALGAVLEGHRKRFERLEQRRRRAEMSVAAELQWDLLPIRGDFFKGVRVAGVLEPAYEVAGDAFDYAWLDGALWAYSFDGMGHGVDATLTSAVALAAVRNARRQGFGLAEQMDRASAALFEHWGGDRFVTGVGFHLVDGVTEFVNAGHEPVRVVQNGAVQRLELRAELPLGVVAAHSYSVESGPTLGDGDGVAMFSDGPAAAAGANDVGELGADRLDEFLQESWTDRPVEAAHDTMGRVLSHIGAADIDDDLTAVLVLVDATVGGS